MEIISTIELIRHSTTDIIALLAAGFLITRLPTSEREVSLLHVQVDSRHFTYHTSPFYKINVGVKNVLEACKTTISVVKCLGLF